MFAEIFTLFINLMFNYWYFWFNRNGRLKAVCLVLHCCQLQTRKLTGPS